MEGNVREIDLGMIHSGSQQTLFCCVAGIGMDAEANARANRMPQWLKSRGGYVLAALQSLIAFKPAEMTISQKERKSGDQRSLLPWEMLLAMAGG